MIHLIFLNNAGEFRTTLVSILLGEQSISPFLLPLISNFTELYANFFIYNLYKYCNDCRANLSRTVLVRVNESRETLSHMTEEELAAVAHRALGLVKTGDATATANSSLINPVDNSSLLVNLTVSCV